MRSTLMIAGAILALAAVPAMAQQGETGQQKDGTARQVHDQVKDGLNSIGTAEEQGSTPGGNSALPDPDTVHDSVHGAIQQGANIFDSATSAIR